MTNLNKPLLAIFMALSMLVACGDDDGNSGPDAAQTANDAAAGDAAAGDAAVGDAAAGDAAANDAAVGDASLDSLFGRLGGTVGITTVVDNFLGKVLANNKINGFFLNASVNNDRLRTCLIKQLSAASGAVGVSYPQVGDPADSDGCRNMQAAHLSMGVSKQDFDDLVADLLATLEEAGVVESDRNLIASVLAPTESAIVEDQNNNESVYQRVGRRPAIEAVVDDFITRVLANLTINGFFLDGNDDLKTDAGRLKVCLVRQVCAIDGPCIYGEEVDNAYEEGDVGAAKQCRDMLSSHRDLTNNSNAKISKSDFDALVAELITSLDEAGVAAADRDAIIGALAPLCNDIVHNPSQGANCSN